MKFYHVLARVNLLRSFWGSVSGYMYKHCDPYDYSCGMERLDDSNIKEIGGDLYDSIYSC